MANQTLIISNLPPECDEAWLRAEARHPENIVSVNELRPDDVEKHGVTLVVEFTGSRAEVDDVVARFQGRTIHGRHLRLYAPIFGS